MGSVYSANHTNESYINKYMHPNFGASYFVFIPAPYMRVSTVSQGRKVDIPEVIFSGPKMSSSAALPPIIVSIMASSCDLVTWYRSFSGM